MARYVVRETQHGPAYVYDELKGQLVWANLTHGRAEELAADLNLVHEESPSPVGVPEGVLERVALQVFRLETQARLKEQRFANFGSDDPAAERVEKEVAELREQASDLRCLLFALGASGV